MSAQFFNRQSIRLPNFDYSSNGTYFVTVCVWQGQKLFGHVVDDKVYLNSFGEIVCREWERSAQIRNEIVIDKYIVMPNHMHGIVMINDVGATGRSPLQDRFDRPRGPAKRSLGALMAGFKTSVTKHINELRQSPKAPVWQRNYYEHIIRNESDYNRIRHYIINNPKNWSLDKYYRAA